MIFTIWYKVYINSTHLLDISLVAQLVKLPCGSAGKESACNVGKLGSIPWLGRSPGEGKDYPFQYSGLENSMDCIVHGVANSWIRLSDFHFLDVTINLWDYSAFFSEKGSTICLWLWNLYPPIYNQIEGHDTEFLKHVPVRKEESMCTGVNSLCWRRQPVSLCSLFCKHTDHGNRNASRPPLTLWAAD